MLTLHKLIFRFMGRKGIKVWLHFVNQILMPYQLNSWCVKHIQKFINYSGNCLFIPEHKPYSSRLFFLNTLYVDPCSYTSVLSHASLYVNVVSIAFLMLSSCYRIKKIGNVQRQSTNLRLRNLKLGLNIILVDVLSLRKTKLIYYLDLWILGFYCRGDIFPLQHKDQSVNTM